MGFRKGKQFTTYDQAINYSLRLVQQRNYSEFGIRQKLNQHQTPPDITEAVITKLKTINAINDERFAESLVRSEATYRHASNRRIAAKLYQKGIHKDLIDLAIPAAPDTPPEEERALHLSERFWQKHGDIEPIERKQKLFAHLARKGFSLSTIQKVYRQLVET